MKTQRKQNHEIEIDKNSPEYKRMSEYIETHFLEIMRELREWVELGRQIKKQNKKP